MTQFLGYPLDFLQQNKAVHTAKEICQQPQIWRKVRQLIQEKKSQLEQFLQPLLADDNLEIILTGAGSSAFAGVALAPWLREKTKRNVYAYGSTEIVANPLQYFSANKKTLLISYARSGNSPESITAVKLAEQIIPDCYHLFLTCNPDSQLSRYANQSDKIFELIMPEGTHDISFAMTSSVSSMMLATLLLFGEYDDHYTEKAIDQIASICEEKLQTWQNITKKMATYTIERIVYVGSSCFTGVAQESALKILELTAGKIATRFDSCLGLRHGPKFIINNHTIVICFLSNNSYTRQYDIDLFNEIIHDGIAAQVIGLSGQQVDNKSILSLDAKFEDCWLIFPYLLFAQMLAFEKSLQCGLNPDNPCPTGEVNRVVKGVNIYPFSH